MAQVYTRTGDKGTTALFGGSRVPKQSVRVSAYGSVDEANTFIGMAKTMMVNDELRDFVHHVGHRLFVLGSELASDVEGRARLIGLVNDDDITEMEGLIDKCMAYCGPQRAFVVPGTEPISAALHIARAAVRRAERMVLTLAETEDVRPEAIKYLNRLSDALYAIARVYEVRHELAELEAEVRAKVAAAQGSADLKDAGVGGAGLAATEHQGTIAVGAGVGVGQSAGVPGGSVHDAGTSTPAATDSNSGPLGAACPAPNWAPPTGRSVPSAPLPNTCHAPHWEAPAGSPVSAAGLADTPSAANLNHPVTGVLGAMAEDTAPVLDVARCRLAADTATRLARAKGVAITFAAVDASGVLLFLQRDDDARFVSVQIAQDKAFTAASMRTPTADLGPLLADGGDFQGLHTSHGGRITAIGGGVPVFINGTFVGGIAVSGGALADDIDLVAKALAAIGGTTQ